MTCKHKIHQLPVDTPFKGPVMQSIETFFVVRLNKPLNLTMELPAIWNTLMPNWRHSNWIILGIDIASERRLSNQVLDHGQYINLCWWRQIGNVFLA